MEYEYVISKNIPIPEKKSRKKEWKYPFDKMEVGDSIYIPELSRSSSYQSARNWSKVSGNVAWGFKAANEGDGSRIWRTK